MLLRAEVERPGVGEIASEKVGFEVGPEGDEVEDGGVGGDGDGWGGDDGGVGVEDDFDFPGPSVARGEIRELSGEAAAVGDGAVEEPVDGRGGELRQCFADHRDCEIRFVDGSIGAVNAREVANAVVNTDQYRTAAQRCFDGNDQVESVDDYRLISDLLHRKAVLLSSLPILLGTRAPRHCQTLPLTKPVAITHQLQRRSHVITSRQQPAQINNSLPKCWQSIRREELRVRRMRAAMSSSIRTHQDLLQTLTKMGSRSLICEMTTPTKTTKSTNTCWHVL